MTGRGNVRELQNVIDRFAIVSHGGPLRLSDLLPQPRPAERPKTLPPAVVVLTEADLKERLRGNIEAALESSGGRVYGRDGAAARLGVKPTTLMSRIKVLGIKRSRS